MLLSNRILILTIASAGLIACQQPQTKQPTQLPEPLPNLDTPAASDGSRHDNFHSLMLDDDIDFVQLSGELDSVGGFQMNLATAQRKNLVAGSNLDNRAMYRARVNRENDELPVEVAEIVKDEATKQFRISVPTSMLPIQVLQIYDVETQSIAYDFEQPFPSHSTLLDGVKLSDYDQYLCLHWPDTYFQQAAILQSRQPSRWLLLDRGDRSPLCVEKADFEPAGLRFQLRDTMNAYQFVIDKN